MLSETLMADSDEGKDVTNFEKTTVSRIVEVRHGRAYVSPGRSATDPLTESPNALDSDDGTPVVSSDRVDTVTSDEVGPNHAEPLRFPTPSVRAPSRRIRRS